MREQDKFISIREEFSKLLEPLTINTEKSCWDFYINSTPENMEKYEQTQDEYSKLFQNRDWYEKFLSINKEDLALHEQKQLKDLLKEFDEELNTGEELKVLRQKENEIAKKYNSYIPMIDGKEVTKTELVHIIQTETNPDVRKKAFDAKLEGGNLISEDLIEFVKQRNSYAKNRGYANFFEYKLKEEYDVDFDFLENLIEEVYSKSRGIIQAIQENKYKELRDFFGVNQLEGYHYGLLLDSNPEKKVNEILKNHNIEEISKKVYSGMGYDINQLVKDGLLTLDLYPRKGKNTHGFCFGVEAGKDSRILANLSNNVISLDTLNHELGHSVYDLGLDVSLPFLDRKPASSTFTEAIAMMMGDIMKLEDVLSVVVPYDLLEKFKQTHSENEANFVSRSLLIIDFEKELYKNPEQSPSELWQNLRRKYLNRKEDANNEWATIPHYLSHPAYYQNYFRATIMKAQIYTYLHSVLGNITENNSTSEYLRNNIFSKGASIDEYDLIKQLTGKEFSADDFVKSL